LTRKQEISKCTKWCNERFHGCFQQYLDAPSAHIHPQGLICNNGTRYTDHSSKQTLFEHQKRSIFSSSHFFFATERCRRKTLRRGRPKWWQSPIDITTRCIAMIVTRLPNFGVKRLRTDVWSSFTVRHSSMFIDVHTQSVAKWNGICSGDNTRVRGCLCICYVSYALSQRDITRYNFIQWNWSGRSVKSRLNISHIFILFRSRIKSSAKWCLIVGEKDLPNC